jgi:hypothetical protein
MAHGTAIQASNLGRPIPSTAMLSQSGGNGKYDKWGDRSTLDDHFDRHGAGVGANSEGEYVEMSQQFQGERFNDGIRSKTDRYGNVRIWDTRTNRFGSYNSDGTTRTFLTADLDFLRSEGYTSYKDWWNAQPGW